jgi:hypothetical protein
MTSLVRSRLSESDRLKANAVRVSLQNDLTEQGFVTCLGVSSTRTTIQLPDKMSVLVRSLLIDSEALDYLTMSKQLNWCRSARLLIPMRNVAFTDDGHVGDSLIRAVSMAMWGLDDVDTICFLRRLVFVALTNPVTTALLLKRWRSNTDVGGSDLGSAVSPQPLDRMLTNDSDWQMVCSVFGDNAVRHFPPSSNGFSSLQPIHVFALSNVLQRPIFILPGGNCQSTGSTTASNLPGIYLPILHDADICCKSPITLIVSPRDPGIILPLVFEAGMSVANDKKGLELEPVVPLVGFNLVPLFVQCLLPDEQPQQLLQQYLRLSELPFTSSTGLNVVPVAKIDVVAPAQDMLAAFVATYTSSSNRAIQVVSSYSPLSQGPPGTSDRIQNVLGEVRQCITPNCGFFGRAETDWKCSECYRKVGIGPPLAARGHVTQQLPGEQPVEGPTSIPGTLLSGTTYVCAIPNCSRPLADYSESHCAEHSPRTSRYGAMGYAPSFATGTVLSPEEGLHCPFPDCTMFGLPERGGYCSRHHLTMLEQAQWTPTLHAKCTNTGCNNRGQDSYNGACSQCYILQKPVIMQTVPADPSSTTSAMGSRMITQQQQRPAASVLLPSSQPQLPSCLIDFCMNPASVDCNGLCHECFTAICRSRLGCDTAVPGVRPSQASNEVDSLPFKRCIMEGCREAAMVSEDCCTKCFAKQQQAYQELLKSPKRLA